MDIKRWLHELLTAAISEACKSGELTASPPSIPVEAPRKEGQGDLSTTVAMGLAATERKSPRQVAEIIVKHLAGRTETAEVVERVDVAGPGYINFTLRPSLWQGVVREVLRLGERFGGNDSGKGQSVLVEYISANPTGPLHVGHGRNAAVGDAVSKLLQASGFYVVREYYVNDAGRQMRLLGESLRARVLRQIGQQAEDPEDGYQGAYMDDLARRVVSELGQNASREPVEGFTRRAHDSILQGIRSDLDQFGVRLDQWVSESKIFPLLPRLLEEMREKDLIYEQDGALWFRSTRYGDDKDRVVRKQDGEYTYLATDIGYHHHKLERGYGRLINVWGADHHGYIPRIEGVIRALGYPKDRLAVILVQMVSLLREGKPVSMSKRAGEFVTLADVLKEVGRDAARFFFLMRGSDSPLEFDLELAKRQSNENPVFYVQYAHARVASLRRQAQERGLSPQEAERADLSLLKLPEELAILKQIAAFPDLVESAARTLEPHRIPHYLLELAGMFHRYYYDHRILTDDRGLSAARLALSIALGVTIRRGLDLLGVSAPERM